MRAPLVLLACLIAVPATAVAQTAKQAVFETSAGTMVWDLLDEKAPAHVAHFISAVEKGELDGTTFHRMMRAPSCRAAIP
ncbi:MAG: peptidylprolyl isomerase [Vicinamibacterales bacterium]